VFLARYRGTRALTLHAFPPQISLLRASPVPRVKVPSLHGSHILCSTNADNASELSLPKNSKLPNNSFWGLCWEFFEQGKRRESMGHVKRYKLYNKYNEN
jgi:hypothetical protein